MPKKMMDDKYIDDLSKLIDTTFARVNYYRDADTRKTIISDAILYAVKATLKLVEGRIP